MKLSIITINYNNAAGLKRTLDSVAAQTYTDFEHIIVDGASTDDSVDEILTYSQSPIANRHQITWISEPDTGIYNAMNKGIKMAVGEYLLFLNSGDTLENADVVSNFYMADIIADIATGIEKRPNGSFDYPRKEEELCYSYFYDNTLLHQSTFIRKDAFERFGMYNENNKVASDWEWFFKVIIKENATYVPLNFIVADFEGYGISESSDNCAMRADESKKVHDTVVPRVCRDYFELKRLQKIEEEYEFLKNGKLGWIVRLLLCVKKIKKARNK